MFNKILGTFSKDIGIDLGTANTLVYVKGRGIVINEPSVVALNNKTGKILAVGKEAKNMVGRTPGHITAIRPLKEGVIADFEVTEQMLKYFIEQVHKKVFNFLPRPRVVIGIPASITEVEKKAVHDAVLSAGAREVYLVEQAMAAAIGARLPIQEAVGNMIVDIGGGTTEIAVISLEGIVISQSLPIAGDKLTQDIIQFARDELNLLLGEKTAEEIKIAIGSAQPLEREREARMRGRDVLSGLPKEIIVSSDEIRQTINRSIKKLINSIKETIEETPPELVADMMDRGIVLVGGGSLLPGLANLCAQETQMPVRLEEDPLTTVVRGTGIVLENLDKLKGVLVPS
ncbi:MAG: rod shape-determining protein [bacterium]